LEDILQTIITLVGIGLFIFAAYGDVKSFRIPNAVVAAVALLGVTRLIVIGDPSVVLYTVGAAFIVLTVGFLLFWLGFCGGGDAKLVTAAALLVGYSDLFSFLLIMSICGGLFSLAVLVIRRYLPLWVGPSIAVHLPKARLSVPYGVAIAAGGVATLFFQSPISFLG
jgi:prepilin peptidase CpaA